MWIRCQYDMLHLHLLLWLHYLLMKLNFLCKLASKRLPGCCRNRCHHLLLAGVASVCASFGAALHAQSDFVNLGFEQVRNVPAFDPQGHARLFIRNGQDPAAVLNDLRQLIAGA